MLMNDASLKNVVDVLRGHDLVLDINGGAPELHPWFRNLVSAARGLERRISVRTNLTVLLGPGMSGLPDFLAGQGST